MIKMLADNIFVAFVTLEHIASSVHCVMESSWPFSKTNIILQWNTSVLLNLNIFFHLKNRM